MLVEKQSGKKFLILRMFFSSVRSDMLVEKRRLRNIQSRIAAAWCVIHWCTRSYLTKLYYSSFELRLKYFTPLGLIRILEK
jgi:hypothetical protein